MPFDSLWLLVAAPILVAALVVRPWLAGGRVTRVGLRAWWLLIAASAIRLALPHLSPGPPSTTARAGAAAGVFLAAAFCWANWRGRTAGSQVGLALVIVGAAANAVPTVWSGAMPFSAGQALAAGLSAAEVARPPIGHVALSGEPAPIAALSDVIAIPMAHAVASVGDLSLLLGAAAVLSSVLPRRTRRRRVPRPTSSHRLRAFAGARGGR